MKKYRSLRAYAGDLCKREGGLSEAKIGDVVQILNMVADDQFEEFSHDFDVTPEEVSCWTKPLTSVDILNCTGANRQLKREKELEKELNRKKKV